MTTVDQKINRAEQILGEIFNNKLHPAEALQAASPAEWLRVAGAVHVVESNKRLAVLGDAVLAKVLCSAWYAARDEYNRTRPPVYWTQIRNDVLGNAALAQLGSQLGVEDCIIMGGGMTGPPSAGMVATALEALIGAVYIDGGDEAVIRVVNHLGLNNHRLLIPYVRYPGCFRAWQERFRRSGDPKLL